MNVSLMAQNSSKPASACSVARTDPSAGSTSLSSEATSRKPSASAYMIDQQRELGNLQLVFGALKTYRHSVDQIESLTGIRFGGLADYDGFSNEERLTGTRIEAAIRGPEDILL